MPEHDNHAPELTASEKRVLNLLAKGQSNKEIAGCLGISFFTVKRHVENILRKLGVRNRIEAAVFSARASARAADAKGRGRLRPPVKPSGRQID